MIHIALAAAPCELIDQNKRWLSSDKRRSQFRVCRFPSIQSSLISTEKAMIAGGSDAGIPSGLLNHGLVQLGRDFQWRAVGLPSIRKMFAYSRLPFINVRRMNMTSRISFSPIIPVLSLSDKMLSLSDVLI